MTESRNSAKVGLTHTTNDRFMGMLQRKIERRRSQLLTRAGMRLIKRIPLRDQIVTREKLEMIRRLDYQRHAIYLSCQSTFDLKRCAACAKEPETVQWIETFVRAGDVMYDIGANVGAYSLVAAKFTHGNAKVYSFEPSPSTFAQLSRNIHLNGCQDSITPLQMALSHQTSILHLCLSNDASGAASHQLESPAESAEGVKANGGKHFQPVLGYRLDDLVRHFSISLPNHIKLDVDGNEMNVLCGAEQILRSTQLKSILVEFDEASDSSAQAIRYLQSLGFRVHSKQNHWTTRVWNYILVRDVEDDGPQHQSQ